MSLPDLINGGLELGGGVMQLANVRRLRRDKTVRGVDWRVSAFFAIWGVWNLYYYPSLGQWASFTGGLAIVAGNIIWLLLALHYHRLEAKPAPSGGA